MKILVVGGSGLLGTYIARAAVERGYDVAILSRGGRMGGEGPVPGTTSFRGDIRTMSETEWRAALEGREAVIYALGLDDRELHRRPSYEVFRDDHVDVCLGVLRRAKAAGARKFLVLGSYFTYFDDIMPELGLSVHHPYIRSRREQREAVLGESRPGFDTFVLELPYIIGALPGRVPPWAFLFEMLAGKGNAAFFFDRGGTAAVTARQVGEATMGAIAQGKGGTAYALGGINLTWPELARRFFAIRGEKKRLRKLPQPLFRLFGFLSAAVLAFAGKERGLDINSFAGFQYQEAFVDPGPAMAALDYGHDDYDAALAGMIGEWSDNRAKGAKRA